MQNRMLLAFLGTAFFSVCAGVAAAAETEVGGWAWGIYGGAYIPEPDQLDTGPTGGFRIGYRGSEHTALSGSLGYTKLDGSTGSGATKIKGDLEAILLDFDVWYIFRPEKTFSFTIGVGPGYVWNDGSIDNNLNLNIDRNHTTDDSLTANAAFGPIIKISENWNLRLLTRFRYIDERQNNDVDKEITLGLMHPLGQKKAAPVVAAAPPPPAPKPPPPPPPAKCPDSDNDGVCDAVDQCPNTPPGKRVGPAGCDCDYTLHLHFAVNSAELSATDKADLDQLATLLKNPKLGFVAGKINGYTDSTGTDAYNLGLSKRRADSVANYLKSQGVTLGERFETNGYGEADPVASNDTADGRSQNRRVVIQRTDCGPA
jgi:outer membrane protein OmpA-like peptidoglycan-associated protein